MFGKKDLKPVKYIFLEAKEAVDEYTFKFYKVFKIPRLKNQFFEEAQRGYPL